MRSAIPPCNAAGLRIGLVFSRYHGPITEVLRDGAVRQFLESGGREDDLIVVPTPGTFELTAICRELATHPGLDAVVALGCVITGETPHDQYICQGVVQGLTQITVQTGVPVAFGVLTCTTLEQAQARAGGPIGNKGTEAMAAAIETAQTLRGLVKGRDDGE